MNELSKRFLASKINILKMEDGASHAWFEFEVSAKPGAKKERLILDPQGIIKVYVVAKAVDGAANKAIAKILGKKFGVAQSQLEIVQGAHAKHKRWRLNYLFTDHKNVDYYCSKIDSFFEELQC